MFFSNTKKVTTSPEREKILAFAEAGIKAVTPTVALPRGFSCDGKTIIVQEKSFNIVGKRIFVIGAGKAASAMAIEVEKILGVDQIEAGIVLSGDTDLKPKKIDVLLADHPIPKENSMRGTQEIFLLKEKHNIGADDLIVALISGGGSAMMSRPAPGISFEDKKRLFHLFITRGIRGYESTIIKTKVSQVKGGALASYFAPTPIISLVLSDDNGESGHHMTASGPFISHPSTFSDAWEVVKKYGIENNIPQSVKSFLVRGKEKNMPNTDHVYQTVIAKNEDACEAIQAAAEKKGIRAFVQTGVRGETKNAARKACKEVFGNSVRKPTLFVYGGETMVTLGKQNGVGGRNQEYVLACLEYLSRKRVDGKWCIAAIATDGVDYIQESTGAIADNRSLDIVHKKNMRIRPYLENHDAYNFLKRIGSNVVASQGTNTNVGDIMLFYRLPR